MEVMFQKFIRQAVHVSAQRFFMRFPCWGSIPKSLWSMMRSCSCVAHFGAMVEKESLATLSIRCIRTLMHIEKVLRFIIAKLTDLG